MRLACGLAIALWLTFPAAAMNSRQQDAAGSGNSSGQAPAPPAVPAQTTPAAGKKPPESVGKVKANAGSASPGPASRTTKGHKHEVPAPKPDDAPRKIVVREGGAREPAAQIVPDMTPAEATRQRQDAEQWLASAGDQLKQLPERTLNARQQETVGQIRNYMEGARSALKDGDVRRANTLALKAHLLADDLVKH